MDEYEFWEHDYIWDNPDKLSRSRSASNRKQF